MNNKDISKDRAKFGNFASITGIVCNILLALIKGICGFVFNSVAIIADAVNNLSDAGTSLISLMGFLIADKPADEEHPYGHARMEYISGMLISFVIMFLGISLLISSVKGIINPIPLYATPLSIGILLVSILTKLWLSLFFKKMSKMINSSVLIATSKDSLNDVISTLAVLTTTLISYFTDVNLDAYAGMAVSVMILYTGFGILKETLNNLLGTLPDKEIIRRITDKLYSYEGVSGIHDLVVHSYGPERYFATVHVEVGVNTDIMVSHDMIDNIERDFLNDMGINMVIHLDPVITDDEETNELKSLVLKTVQKINGCFTIHDFRMVKGDTHSNLIFDVVVPASCKITTKDLIDKISSDLRKKDSSLYAVITIDRGYVPERN